MEGVCINSILPMSAFEQVYAVVRQIPRGRVTSYGAISNYLSVGSPRMVGWAMNHSFHADPPVPAHRVVNRKGELTGRNHFPNPDMMQRLLELEGVQVEDHTVIDFQNLFWDPAQEMAD